MMAFWYRFLLCLCILLEVFPPEMIHWIHYDMEMLYLSRLLHGLLRSISVFLLPLYLFSQFLVGNLIAQYPSAEISSPLLVFLSCMLLSYIILSRLNNPIN